jgi:hypothetical protein
MRYLLTQNCFEKGSSLGYALGLEPADPAFDFSSLSESRSLIVQVEAEQMLMDAMLDLFKDFNSPQEVGSETPSSVEAQTKLIIQHTRRYRPARRSSLVRAF